MKFKYYINLLKTGYNFTDIKKIKRSLDIMTIKEILKLGEMGYTKEEIDKMDTEPKTEINDQITKLEEQVKALKDNLEVNNARQTVTTEPGPDGGNTIDDALKILAGGGTSE